MKTFILGLLLMCSIFSYAQDSVIYQIAPRFENCKETDLKQLDNCFNQEVYKTVYSQFRYPESVESNYIGEIAVIFEVTKGGVFKTVYIDAQIKALKEELIRVFSVFPVIQPATYNGNPTFKQYSMTLHFPLNENNKSSKLPAIVSVDTKSIKKVNQIEQLTELQQNAKREFDSVQKSVSKYTNKAYKSQVNIPFSHENYFRFDQDLNRIGTNNHTASKPYKYEDVSNYYDFESENEALQKQSKTWVGRKLWNEHLVQLQSEDYWFTIDPILDLQLGKDTDADFGYTYNNTRGAYVQGGLGDKLSFSASVYENQGRFAQYYNEYAESLKAFGPDPAIIPGRGIAKRFKEDAYDYPVAEGYLSYSPAKFLNVQFGHGKQFIGDGYRSLLQSDVSSPYPFLKLNTKFWNIKYTNTWTWLKDVRDDVTLDKAFLTKYIANHYLSWNVTKRFNLGLFESVIWENSNDRGFDVNYLNPLIFFRAIEFETGQGAGNAIVGASGKYKLSDNANVYGQFILDEFSLSDVTGGDRSWKNKYGFQLGAKWYNAFNVKKLMLQAEYNQVRPYTYSHNTIVLNYAHNNQPMAHLWGANFKELVLIGRYQKERWFGEAKLIAGIRGLDVNDGTDDFSYGGDIYRNYNDRPFDTGVSIGQGIKTTSINASAQLGYLVNPASNLKAFVNISYRNFNPEAETLSAVNNSTVWINFGLRTDLFNWYFDM
ncbi:gliding motility protein RemB [Psychroserpens sp. NJDZ02]|uniref:gliding motility protein RemB n=1 Tax=Psychroserpens sp. NJDZ02 TaxID=2570561 RepID=UPI0010A770A8|nr:gliding motility protein RemB [Psychroserpens sp. NJDZ02]QCE41590.1 gliding motility protein RemB [Psychroserpens sp. NJDZ02]